MKKVLAILIAAIMVVSLVACGTTGGTGGSSGKTWVLGVGTAQFADTHLSNVRRVMEKRATSQGIDIKFHDGKNDAGTLEDGLQNFITQKVNVVATNNLVQGSSSHIIDKFKAANIPVIIWNASSPTDEEMASYDKVWFVSSAAEESGKVQGEVAAQWWKDHPESDRNGNGVLDYVILMGTPGFYDTVMRTEWCIRVIDEMGIKTNSVANEYAEFQVAKAQDVMAAIIASHRDNIEFVFANNDDMAIGAISSLKAAGFFADEKSYIPVFGVDATLAGIEMLKEGTMLATSFIDPVAMGEAVMAVVQLLREGKEVNTENLNAVGDWMPKFNLEVTPERRIWTHYRPIDATNYESVSFE